MLEYMKKVVLFGQELNTEERNLLSVAYKNTVGSRRFIFYIQNSLARLDLDLVKRRV
jgi:14-3-3 protein epsilon